MVNISKLKGKLIENKMNVAQLAGKLGIDKGTMYRKLNSEGKNITIRDAIVISKELQLTLDEVNAIFFNQIVAQNANRTRKGS